MWPVFAPMVQVLAFDAFRAQSIETRSRGSGGALDVQGMVIQAVVFLLVGISFLYRFRMPSEGWNVIEHWFFHVQDWYWMFGWATINNVIFALGQGRLAWIVWRQQNSNRSERIVLLA